MYFRLLSPERGRPTIPDSLPLKLTPHCAGRHRVASNSPSPSPSREEARPIYLYVPEVEEIRISPVVSKKGTLHILEEKKKGWSKRWVVSYT